VRSTIDTGSALSVAVLLPCLDEETTVAEVVAGFRTALPDGIVYVYDNGLPTRPLSEHATLVPWSEPSRRRAKAS